MTKKVVLGKGLDALLGGGNDVTVRPERVTDRQIETKEESLHTGVSEIPINTIQANPDQPRTHFDEETLHELAASIKSVGLVQPVTVRETTKDHYQIISGERRFRAARLAGLSTIPVYIRTADDDEVIKLALIENLQREDLNPLEISISFQRLMDELALTQEQLSETVGKKRATVANYLRLLSLPPEIQVFIRERKLTMGHARALAGLNDAKLQLKIARKVIDEDLSVRKVEELVKKQTTDQSDENTGKPAEPALPDNYSRLIELLGVYFTNNINVKRNEKGAGTITIRFKQDEEINRFIQNLSNSNII